MAEPKTQLRANAGSIHGCNEIKTCQYHGAAVPEYEDFAAVQLCSISKAVQEAGQAQGPLEGVVLKKGCMLLHVMKIRAKKAHAV
jgi:hypothetical protein